VDLLSLGNNLRLPLLIIFHNLHHQNYHPSFNQLYNKEYFMVLNLIESFIDNVCRDTVSTPAIGSVLYCDIIFGLVSHSGIYIGENTIIHLDGDGTVTTATPNEFLDRLEGINTAMSIYVSCNGTAPTGAKEVVLRALKTLGDKRDYNILFDNCHQFTAGCLSGDFEGNAANFLWILKMEADKYIDADSWRVWNRN